ncbi:MAG: DUF805 domain-containing protein [Selenomonadales bacterium]|nr:DUF805 domain-containing protein [Selenomonadales bacterium]
MKHKITSLQIAQLFLIGFLLIITTDRFSSGVYTLLRILATIISVWSAIKTDNNILKLIFAFIAILFNPIILIKLDRDEWQLINLIVALFYAGNILYPIISKYRKTPKIPSTPQSVVKSDIVCKALQPTQEVNVRTTPTEETKTPSTDIQPKPQEHITIGQRFSKLFQGRLGRLTFAIRFIFTFIGAMCCGIIYSSIFSTYVNPDMFFVAVFCLLVLLALIVYWFSIVIRRLHDINASGFYSIPLMVVQSLGIIGFVGIIVLACFPGTKGRNKYGEQPK